MEKPQTPERAQVSKARALQKSQLVLELSSSIKHDYSTASRRGTRDAAPDARGGVSFSTRREGLGLFSRIKKSSRRCAAEQSRCARGRQTARAVAAVRHVPRGAPRASQNRDAPLWGWVVRGASLTSSNPRTSVRTTLCQAHCQAACHQSSPRETIRLRRVTCARPPAIGRRLARHCPYWSSWCTVCASRYAQDERARRLLLVTSGGVSSAMPPCARDGFEMKGEDSENSN